VASGGHPIQRQRLNPRPAPPTVDPEAAVGEGVAEEEGGSLIGAAFGAIGAGLVILLWPSDIAPEPKLPPDPRPRRRKRRECESAWAPPAGGNPNHDAYAQRVALRYGDPTYATLDYYVAGEGGAAKYDHYNPEMNEFFEVKTRHEPLLNEWARNQPMILARLYEQAVNQFNVMIECAPTYPGPRLIWFFDNPDVAEAAADYLRGVVDEVRHEPFPGPAGSTPARRRGSRATR